MPLWRARKVLYDRLFIRIGDPPAATSTNDQHFYRPVTYQPQCTVLAENTNLFTARCRSVCQNLVAARPLEPAVLDRRLNRPHESDNHYTRAAAIPAATAPTESVNTCLADCASSAQTTGNRIPFTTPRATATVVGARNNN